MATKGAAKGGGGESGAPSAPQDEPGFDRRLERLEEIVRELEEGGLALELGIERYREGVALLGRCREILEGYRRQVEELTRGASALSTRPYEADPDFDGDDAGRAGNAER
jgi:exodeoxyribonuclease VII small subunit